MIICMIGATEIILICVVIFMIFGGKKIPELMKGVGQGVRQFKKGMNEDEEPTLSQEEKYRLREEMKAKIIQEKEKEESLK